MAHLDLLVEAPPDPAGTGVLLGVEPRLCQIAMLSKCDRFGLG